MNCAEICIEHRAIKPLSISLYYKNEIRYQLCDILREFYRLGCTCYGYIFGIKTGNVTSGTKYGAFLRSAVNSWWASLSDDKIHITDDYLMSLCLHQCNICGCNYMHTQKCSRPFYCGYCEICSKVTGLLSLNETKYS